MADVRVDWADSTDHPILIRIASGDTESGNVRTETWERMTVADAIGLAEGLADAVDEVWGVESDG